MEDAHLTETGLPGEAAATALFAVFDGHGGHEVSKFCERHFPAELSNEAAGAPDLVPGLVKTFHRMDDMIGSGQHMRELIAPMPLAVARPASAPSRLAMRSSSRATVGFEMRE